MDVKAFERGPIMDAKYNWIIDSFALRVVINLTVFTAWLAGSYLLLK